MLGKILKLFKELSDALDKGWITWDNGGGIIDSPWQNVNDDTIDWVRQTTERILGRKVYFGCVDFECLWKNNRNIYLLSWQYWIYH